MTDPIVPGTDCLFLVLPVPSRGLYVVSRPQPGGE